MRIESITRADADDAIDVLCAAFVDYPVMRLTLADAGDDYDERLRALIGSFCNKRWERNWPVLGVRAGERLAAVALVSEPGESMTPPEIEAMREELAEHIGEAAFDRLSRYEEVSDLDSPQEPCYFLGMIGVRPENQGEGLARVLMDELVRMSARHPDSTGVCLSTEVESNVGFYEYLGYRTLGRRTVDGMETWCMFRPDD